jgi:hypothetical protein
MQMLSLSEMLFQKSKGEDKNKIIICYAMTKLNNLEGYYKRPFIYLPGNTLLYVR